MPPSVKLPLPVQQLIDRQCDCFEAAWIAGSCPKIEDYLSTVDHAAQSTFFEELLYLELHHRRSAGEEIVCGDYNSRFPAFVDVISRVLTHDSAQSVRQCVQSSPATPAMPRVDVADSDVVAFTRFRVLRPHAKGGLGQISIAFDRELQREVAVKEMQAQLTNGPQNQWRFIREAEITGRLEHPGIVPVYGIGKYADGRPFYAMRFIKGRSLAERIRELHATDKNGLRRNSVAFRLELRDLLGRFLDVCDAVSYAHSRCVLHRDLKPQNIMLGDYGETLVVDWGLANWVNGLESATANHAPQSITDDKNGSNTAPGELLGTPQYMSPEQASGRWDEVGAATDVYSLGATLYCLLTGVAPIRNANMRQMLVQVQTGAWRRPRQVAPDTPSALESICLKAMAVRPCDRYASVLELSEDLRRWLSDQPVSAHPERWMERSLRWMRTHPRTMNGVAIALLLGMAGAIAIAMVVSLLNAKLSIAESKARHEATRAKRIAEFMLAALKSPDPAMDGRQVTVASVLDHAMREVTLLKDMPVEQADFLDVLGYTYYGLGLYRESAGAQKKSIQARERYQPDDTRSILESKNELVSTYLALGRGREGLALARDNLSQIRTLLPHDRQLLILSMNSMAAAYANNGMPEEARSLYERTLKLANQLPDDGLEMETTVGQNLADSFLSLGQPDKALSLLQRLSESARRKWGDRHPLTLGLMQRLGVAYQATEQLDRAGPIFEECLAVRREVLGIDHADTLVSLKDLASVRRAQGRLDEAIALFDEVLNLRQATLGADHPDTLLIMNHLGSLYKIQGRLDHAIPLFHAALAGRRRVLRDNHPDTLASMNNMALALKSIGKLNEAISLLTQTSDLIQAELPPDHPHVIASSENLASAYEANDELDKAQTLFEEVLALRRSKLGEDHPDTLQSKRRLAGVYLRTNRRDDGLRMLEEVLRNERERLAKDPRALAELLRAVGRSYFDAEEFSLAESAFRESLELLRSQSGVDWRVFDIESHLGAALASGKQYTQAKPLLVRGYKGLRQQAQAIPRPLPLDVQAAAQRLVDFATATHDQLALVEWQSELERADNEIEQLGKLVEPMQREFGR